VNDDRKPRINFPIRLAGSLRDRVRFLASLQGVSLNQFISQAIEEKVKRLIGDPTSNAEENDDDIAVAIDEIVRHERHATEQYRRTNETLRRALAQTGEGKEQLREEAKPKKL
jgi:hypothetical protein